jgi:hypothetical protein
MLIHIEAPILSNDHRNLYTVRAGKQIQKQKEKSRHPSYSYTQSASGRRIQELSFVRTCVVSGGFAARPTSRHHHRHQLDRHRLYSAQMETSGTEIYKFSICGRHVLTVIYRAVSLDNNWIAVDNLHGCTSADGDHRGVRARVPDPD